MFFVLYVQASQVWITKEELHLWHGLFSGHFVMVNTIKDAAFNFRTGGSKDEVTSVDIRLIEGII